jgi:hypothetical protein
MEETRRKPSVSATPIWHYLQAASCNANPASLAALANKHCEWPARTPPPAVPEHRPGGAFRGKRAGHREAGWLSRQSFLLRTASTVIYPVRDWMAVDSSRGGFGFDFVLRKTRGGQLERRSPCQYAMASRHLPQLERVWLWTTAEASPSLLVPAASLPTSKVLSHRPES